MTSSIRLATALAALLSLAACSGGTGAPSASRPSTPATDTGSMALPTANTAPGNISTTRVR